MQLEWVSFRCTIFRSKVDLSIHRVRVRERERETGGAEMCRLDDPPKARSEWIRLDPKRVTESAVNKGSVGGSCSWIFGCSSSLLFFSFLLFFTSSPFLSHISFIHNIMIIIPVFRSWNLPSLFSAVLDQNSQGSHSLHSSRPYETTLSEPFLLPFLSPFLSSTSSASLSSSSTSPPLLIAIICVINSFTCSSCWGVSCPT